MNANKELYKSLKKKGVSAKLISTVLNANNLLPKRARRYEEKTIFSLINNEIEDDNLKSVMISIENFCGRTSTIN